MPNADLMSILGTSANETLLYDPDNTQGFYLLKKPPEVPHIILSQISPLSAHNWFGKSGVRVVYNPFLFNAYPFPLSNNPGVLSVNLSSTVLDNTIYMNAGDVVGVVTVTAIGGPYNGQIVLSGSDASKFVLTNNGFLPCNLVVGPLNIPAGNYDIVLTAT